MCREKCSSGQLKCEIFLPTLSTADDGRVPTEHYCVSWLLWNSVFRFPVGRVPSTFCMVRKWELSRPPSLTGRALPFELWCLASASSTWPSWTACCVNGARGVVLCNGIPLCGLLPVVPFLKRTSVPACHWGKLAPQLRAEHCWADGSEHVSYCMTHWLCAVFSREITKTQIAALDPSLPHVFFFFCSFLSSMKCEALLHCPERAVVLRIENMLF